MTVQDIPSGVETLVQLCCLEFESAGATVVATDGPNSYVAGSAAGLYQCFATIPYTASAFAEGVTELVLPDGATDMNSAGATNLPWATTAASGPSFSFDPLGGDPSVVFSRFAGVAKHTVSVSLLGGTPGESVELWVLKNTTDVLPGVAVAIFDPTGLATLNLVAVDPSAASGDQYQVTGSAVGAPSSPAFPIDVTGTWLAERVTAPFTSVRLAVYDSSGAHVYDADTDEVDSYRGTLRLASLVMLSDSGRVSVIAQHDFGVSDMEIASTTHLDLAYIGVGVPIEDCPSSGGGG